MLVAKVFKPGIREAVQIIQFEKLNDFIFKVLENLESYGYETTIDREDSKVF